MHGGSLSEDNNFYAVPAVPYSQAKGNRWTGE